VLRYKEANWKYEKGLKTCKCDLAIDTIIASKTRKDQQTKIEKISLVAFLNEDQRNFFVNICRRLKRNDKDFYQNKNLHATLFGFGPLKQNDYEKIQRKIQEFCSKFRKKLCNKIIITFDEVRPGTMYLENKTLRPLHGMSNGTVIAVGDVSKNEGFFNYSNQLGSFLLMDKDIESILGASFRRKLPSVWCTLGYYNKENEFKIGKDLQYIFSQYGNLISNEFRLPITEISLVKSKYKNLRYSKLIQKYQL